MNLAKKVLTLALAASMLQAPVAFASASAPTPAPTPALLPCIIIIIIVIQYSPVYGGGTETITANGQATWTTLQTTDNPFSETLALKNLTLNGQSAIYGAFTSSANLNIPTQNTTVKANQTTSKFPATGNIFFAPTVTLAAFPGVTFRGQQVQQLQNTNLTSYDPQNNERWTLVNPGITFVDAAGRVAFTLQTQTTTVN